MYNKRAFHQKMNHHLNSHKSCGEHPRMKAWKEKFNNSFATPPANVRELDDKFELHVIAPGFEKGDFNIALLDQTISISVNDKNEDQDNWKRQEYRATGFERRFELNEEIDKEAINAKYENGVLVVELPKMEGFETTRQEIKIS